jgi:hypothetical protein
MVLNLLSEDTFNTVLLSLFMDCDLSTLREDDTINFWFDSADLCDNTRRFTHMI